MLQSVVWRLTRDQQRATRVAARSGLVVGGIVIALAIYALTQERLFEAIWGGIIGMFIFRGAQASEQRIGIDGRLASATVAEAMDPPPPAVPADLSLSQTLDRFLRGHEEEAFPVIQDGTVIGMISFNSARELGVEIPSGLPGTRSSRSNTSWWPTPTNGSTRSRRGWGPIALRWSCATDGSSAPSAAPASTGGPRAPADHAGRRPCPSTAVASRRWPPSNPILGSSRSSAIPTARCSSRAVRAPARRRSFASGSPGSSRVAPTRSAWRSSWVRGARGTRPAGCCSNASRSPCRASPSSRSTASHSTSSASGSSGSGTTRHPRCCRRRSSSPGFASSSTARTPSAGRSSARS